MKKILGFILTVCMVSGVAHVATAQAKFNEGKIVFDITYPGTELDENTLAMMPQEMTMYVKKDMSRMEMKTGMGMVTSISNAKDQSAVSLMDMMGNKMAIRMTKEDIEKERDKGGKPFVKITNETKEIAGYKCKKAIVTKEGHSYNVWFTKDIEAFNTTKNMIEGVDGFMMEFEIQQQGMNMKLTARTVEKQPVADDMFKIPTGYKEMTMEEMKKMGMGKNMKKNAEK